ncbi:MAG: AAA-like domain-containing protein [Gammaproteobacteria bacterium]
MVTRLIDSVRQRARARRRSGPTATGLAFEVPTGALAPDSRLYVERAPDATLRSQLAREGSTTAVEGARQMGKSSLLVRAIAQCRRDGHVVVYLDFQDDLDEQSLDDLPTLLRQLADLFHERLRLATAPTGIWGKPIGVKARLTSYVQDHILRGAATQVTLIMDEVDRVFGRRYQDDFFGMLRSWHNRRAREPLWRRLNLVLSCSTDPRQSIEDPKQSPFNVGEKIGLDGFSAAEVWTLNGCYDHPLKSRRETDALAEFVGGHPYLVQRALYALKCGTHGLASLLDAGDPESGPFSEHLQRVRAVLESEPALKRGMQQVLRNDHCDSYEVFFRLRSIGLVIGMDPSATSPRCKLYSQYLDRVLSWP